MKALVIIPTYNERENLPLLLQQILNLKHQVTILIVDDNSPDKTSELVQNHPEFERRIFLLKRTQKMGLGTAYVAGFLWAQDKNFDLVCQMDADFSHSPRDLERLIDNSSRADLVIGSRYVKGGKVVNWPYHRYLLSYFANIYARFILGAPIKDLTGGFKCFHAYILKNINVESLESLGYSFQIETNMRAYRNGYKIIELPITFTERLLGFSKMSKKIIFEALLKVIKLKLNPFQPNHYQYNDKLSDFSKNGFKKTR